MTVALLGVNAALYLLMAVTAERLGFGARLLVAWGGNLGELSLHGQPWRLLSAMFLHASLMHVFGNLTLLAITGPVVEARIGRLAMLAGFLVCGLAGSLCSALVHPDIVSVGASGAIAGLLGLMVALYFAPGGIQVPGAWLAQTIGINAVFSFLPGVDAWAHAGGFVAGLAFGALLAFRPAPPAAPAAPATQDQTAAHGHAPPPTAADDRKGPWH